MKIKLKILRHQVDSINAVKNVFKNIKLKNGKDIYQNPIFDPKDNKFIENIQKIQNGDIEGLKKINVPKKFDNSSKKEKEEKKLEYEPLVIDVKMETGTGKTYCYTRMMYELHKDYGFNKFIILVPSTPIKEGTKNFILSDYSKEHFNDIYKESYLKLEVLNAIKNSKKRRKLFPQSISDFARGSSLEKNRINCLLMTDKMLISEATMENEYDQVLFGNYSIPYNVLKNVKPIVIIDEPHRFKEENEAYKRLLEKIGPLAIVRFGATFPKKKKSTETDYKNLIYNLNSVEAFNNGLVKGVAVQTLGEDEKNNEKIKLMSMTKTKPKKVKFKNEKNGKEIELSIDQSLAEISEEFQGISIEAIGKTEDSIIKSGVTLSNGQVLGTGDILYPTIYGNNYQELMLSQALNNHFKQEKENFFRERKIKTLSLFFIDSVNSYRGENNDGYLRLRFEKILKNKLEEEIKELSENLKTDIEKEYLEYLKVSLKNINETNGGYFSVDNSTKDEDIQNEVDQILKDKEKLLSFKDENNNWNIMRFIFSKWTLREGWDNPNVFQIVKLRSSGSEISKLQEVGRGLRLPVDEYGNRVDNEEFYLTYLIDFTEKDFANKLIEEINFDGNKILKISDELLSKVAKRMNKDENILFAELLINGYVDKDRNINLGKKEEFFNKYPEFNAGLLKNGKVIDETTKPRDIIKIRKERFNELKFLWEKLTQKYYLQIESLSDEEILEAIRKILSKGVYDKEIVRATERKISNENFEIKEEVVNHFEVKNIIPYNEFLKKIHSATNFPLTLIHKGIIEFNKNKKIEKDFFDLKTVEKFIVEYQNWLEETFLKRFTYKKIESLSKETAFTDIYGNVKENILQGNIGVYKDDGEKVPEKFLFDSFIYDSTKEKETIKYSNSIKEIVVFGKIPRRSIQIPLYFGGTTSPDFMYVLKRKDNSYEINLIVETKGVEKESGLRNEEKLKIKNAEIFFKIMSNEGINIKFRKQLKSNDISKIIEDIIKQK